MGPNNENNMKNDEIQKKISYSLMKIAIDNL